MGISTPGTRIGRDEGSRYGIPMPAIPHPKGLAHVSIRQVHLYLTIASNVDRDGQVGTYWVTLAMRTRNVYLVRVRILPKSSREGPWLVPTPNVR